MGKMKMTLRPSPTALLNPRCDPSFKALFTQETKESNTALADFISAMLDRNVSHVELLPNEPGVDSQFPCTDAGQKTGQNFVEYEILSK